MRQVASDSQVSKKMRHSSRNSIKAIIEYDIRRRKRIAKVVLFIIAFLTGAVYIILSNEAIRNTVVEKLQQMKNGKNKDDRKEIDGRYEGSYPKSLITLFDLYTLLSDIVFNQPIPLTDTPFFWYIHGSNERIMKRILTSCFGLELVQLDDLPSIHQAKETNLVSTLDRY